MIFAAIDPGAVSAAIAVFSDATPLFVDDIRTTSGQIDSVALAKALHDMRVAHAVIEACIPCPARASPARSSLAWAGIIHGVAGALQLPLTLVTPSKWKAYHGSAPTRNRGPWLFTNGLSLIATS